MRARRPLLRGVKFPSLAPAIAASLAILLSGGCAEDSGNLLAGAWELDHFYCEDERFEVPAGVEIILEYGDSSDGFSGDAFRARFRNTVTGCEIQVSGTYRRSGLTVKEIVDTQTCTGALPCTIAAIPPAAAATVCNAASTTFDEEKHTFIANLGLGGDPEVMSQYDHSPLQFCGSGTFFEQQVFGKSP